MTTTHRTPPRWVRWTLTVVAVLVPCVVWGVTTATADLSLGPHEARYEVTTDSVVTVDLGPLGTLQIDSPLPAGLGASVTVKEIPADLTAVDQATTLAGLTNDLESYLQFFSGPQESIGHAVRALVVDALRRTGFAILVAGAVGALGYVVLGAARRDELTSILAPRTWEITASVAIVSLVAGSLSSSTQDRDLETTTPTSAVFAGTPLEGARITGRLAGIVDTYGGMVVDFLRENDEFYDMADKNLVAAWDQRDAIDEAEAEAEAAAAAAAAAAEAETGTGPDAGADTGGDAIPPDAVEGTEGTAGTGASDGPPTPSPSPSPTDDAELVTMLLISDLHCNIGMAPLIRTTIDRSSATLVLNAGDTTMNGTAVENFCVDAYMSALPKGTTMVVADGNHDSTETSARERSRGAKVLDGGILDVQGIRILGDSDAMAPGLIEGPTTRAGGAVAQAARLTDVACEAEDGIDILLIHTPRVGNVPMESGCVPAQLSGHMHTRADPEQVGGGIRYVNGSTAGAIANASRIGPLKGTAEMTLLRFDPVERRIVDWQIVSVTPDGAADVGPRQPWPLVVEQPVPDEDAVPPGEEGADVPPVEDDAPVDGVPAG
ncbi:metallophosphoesterase [Oerskovia sp. NPDC057915]|uniref:metallophosphoesterase family protein n=1 Tax=Oerskovia sp. NPDC057915 TaxID=3346280 RepID=UPI0036D83B8B